MRTRLFHSIVAVGSGLLGCGNPAVKKVGPQGARPGSSAAASKAAPLPPDAAPRPTLAPVSSAASSAAQTPPPVDRIETPPRPRNHVRIEKPPDPKRIEPYRPPRIEVPPGRIEPVPL
jgi:hypothetical protein